MKDSFHPNAARACQMRPESLDTVLCIFNNVIYMLFYILHEITRPIKKLYLST